MIAVTEEAEHRVAFLDLALAHGPQINGAIDDARCATGFELGLQCQAVELRDIESLVELLVDVKVFIKVADTGEVQGVAVTQLTRRLEDAVASQKIINVIVIGLLSAARNHAARRSG